MPPLLANLIALLHGLFVLFLITGVIVSLTGKLKKNRKIEWLFVISLILTTFSFMIFGSCFLTNIEKALRARAGAESYEGGFISHYLGEFGIVVADNMVFWFLTILIVVGIFSEVYHNRKNIGLLVNKIKI